MMSTTKQILAFSCLVIVSLHSTSQAGVLNGHAAAFNGISGTVPFNDGAGLSGSVDYAVFTAGAFDANFSGLGYVPSGELVYAYQVENTGSQGITGETIGVSNPASSIGTFDLGGIDAISAAFIPDADWMFAPEIAPGESSWGLAFSSSFEPIVGFSTIGGDMSHMFAGVPVPGHIEVPEPGSATILAWGAILLGLSRCVLRRR